MSVTVDTVIVELEARLRGYNRDVNGARENYDRAMRDMRTATAQAERDIARNAGGIRTALLSSVSALATGVSLAGIKGLTDAYTTYTNALKTAGLEGERLAASQANVANVANKFGTDLVKLGQLYANLSTIQKDLNATDAQTLQVTTAVAAALRIQGGSAESAGGAILGLRQAFASPLVQAQEFNQILDGALPILQAAAGASEKYGGSVSKLRQDILAMNVTGRDFFDLVLKGSATLEGRAASASLTYAAALQIVSNQLVRFIGQTDQGLGASARLTAGLTGLANNLDTIIPALTVLAGVMAGRYVSSMVAGQRAQDSLTQRMIASTRAAITEAETRRATAGAALASARAEVAASQTVVNASAAKQAALMREQALYRAQIVSAQQALVAANSARAIATTLGAPTGQAEAARAAAILRLADASRILRNIEAQLVLTEAELTAARAGLTATTAAATAATTAYGNAVARTTVLARVGTLASRALAGALALIGGPIGLAITAVAVALAYFVSQAGAGQRAAEAAASSLAELRAKGEAAGVSQVGLANDTNTLTKATDASASASTRAAQAYDIQAVSAANAAVAIREMAQADRAAYIDRLEREKSDLQRSVSGGGMLQTNQQEKVRNARTELLESLGVRSTGGFNASQNQIINKARADAEAGRLSRAQAKALQEYEIQGKTLEAQTRQLKEYTGAIIGAKQEASGVTVPGSRPQRPGGAEIVVTGPSRKQRQSALEDQLAVANAAGDDDRARAIQEQLSVIQLRTKYEKEGMKPAEAKARAEAQAAAVRQAGDARDGASEGRSAARSQAAEARRAAAAAKAERRDEVRFQNDKASAQQRLGAAMAEAADTEEARVDQVLQSLDIERQLRAAELKRLVADGVYEQAEADLITATEEAARDQEAFNARRNAMREVTERRERARDEAEAEADSLQVEALRAIADNARTRAERFDIERQLLELAQAERRARAEALLAVEGVTEATKQRMRDELAALEAAEREGQRLRQRSPLEQVGDKRIRNRGELRERTEDLAAENLDNFGDALVRLRTGAITVADAFEEIAGSIIEDVQRLLVEQFVQPQIADFISRQIDKVLPAGAEAVGDAAGATATATAITTAGTVVSTALTTAATAGGAALSAVGTAVGTGLTTVGGLVASAITAAGTAVAAAIAAAGASSGASSGITSILSGGGKARGGIVYPGSAYPINENTPNSERFLPLTGGTVVPNEQAAGARVSIQPKLVVQNLGPPLKPEVKQGANGETRLTLLPVLQQGLEQAAATGGLARAQNKAKQPVRRV